jgi:hypothetical protein
LVGKPEGKIPFGKQGIDGRMVSELGGGRVDPVGSGQGPVAGCYEYGDEPARSDAK